MSQLPRVVTMKFICQLCDLEQELTVRERRQGEEISSFVQLLNQVAHEAHFIARPQCPATHLDIAIPVSSNGLGYAGDRLTDEEMEDLKRQVRG